jgi:hypothetical protein
MVGVATEPGRGSAMFDSWWRPIAGDTASSAIGKCRPHLGTQACYAIVKKFGNKKGAT